MTIPTIESIGDVFVLNWEKEKVKIKLDRLYEKSEGITGEMLITQNEGHLYHARINLLSAHSKKVLANELSSRIDKLDWQAMIEQACTKTLLEYRKGEPVIQVGNLPKRETPRYRLKPFVLENELTSIYAYGGSGKSVIADFITVMVQSGVALLGFDVLKGNVLYLDWESSKETIDERVKAIKKGMGINDNELPYYRRCHRLVASEIVEIQMQVLEKNISLVIIDSAGMASGFDDYHASAMDMLRAMRSLNIAVLIIDHKPKGSDTMFGSVYKTNECRACFEIKAIQEEGTSIMRMGIFHTKANDTRKHRPIGLQIDFIGDDDYTDEIVISKQGIEDMPELEEGLSIKLRIIGVLKHGAREVKDIAEDLELPEPTIRTTLNRNKKSFVRTEGGWGLLRADEYA